MTFLYLLFALKLRSCLYKFQQELNIETQNLLLVYLKVSSTNEASNQSSLRVYQLDNKTQLGKLR